MYQTHSAFFIFFYLKICIGEDLNSSNKIVDQDGRHLHINSSTSGKPCPSTLTVSVSGPLNAESTTSKM